MTGATDLHPVTYGRMPHPSRTSFTVHEIAKLGGVGVKTLVAWRREGLLPRASGAGRNSRYGREAARLACAIGLLGVRSARSWFFQELIPIVLNEIPRPTAPRRAAEASSTPSPPPVPAAAPPATIAAPIVSATATASEPPLGVETWQRVVLTQGLELHVSDALPPMMRGLVREVAKGFGRTL
jgi:hypothetical protein